jgi:hypothetical protein
VKLGFWKTLLILLLMLAAISASQAWTGPNCEHHTNDDRIAMACNIYFEARNESYEGMLAVVAVTMNRVASPKYPDTVAEVVWQRRQFSWTHDGKIDRPKHRPSWAEAYAIAGRFALTSKEKDALCDTPTRRIRRLIGRSDGPCEGYRLRVANYVNIASLIDPTGGALW